MEVTETGEVQVELIVVRGGCGRAEDGADGVSLSVREELNARTGHPAPL